MTNHSRVTISGTIQVQDYEQFDDNEYASEQFTNHLTLSDANPQEFMKIPPPRVCAGGEVRPEYEIKATRIPGTGEIQITVEGRLYEGTTCGTTDVDGGLFEQFNVWPNQTENREFHMRNDDEEEPEDYASIELSVNNVPL